jgi:hypothetical protein
MFGKQPTTPAPAPQRHALNLPAGSIRALLALGVLGYLWVLVLQKGGLANKDASLAFIYLQALMLLILAHFFTAHHSTIGAGADRRSPLGLPRGSVRILLMAGYIGLAAYLYLNQPAFELPETDKLVVLPLVLVSAFFAGYLLTVVMRTLAGGYEPAWFQDIKAWVAIVALFLLGIVVVVRTLINTSLPLEDQVPLYYVEAGLAGAVGLYFGSRW